MMHSNPNSSSIDPAKIDEVRHRVSFVEIASEFIQLKQTGRRFVGLCPFHSEKTPSFSVNEEDGLFYCFGCGKKGTVFDFLMEMRGYSFPESVRVLAAKVGVEIPSFAPRKPRSSRSGSPGGADGQDESGGVAELSTRDLYKLMQFVANAYALDLRQSSGARQARDYLEARGITPATCDAFAVGFAPENRSFLDEHCRRWAAEGGFPFESSRAGLLELGLLKAQGGGDDGSQPGRVYCPFRGRLMFPVTRSDSAIIGFGGRIISTGGGGGPKYINSSESRIYLKRRSFYGLSQAVAGVRTSRQVFLVEGYMDVLAMHQSGKSNSIASCGTAITADHVHILARLCDRVSLVFDGDTAGRKAAASCFELFLGSGVQAEVITLPQGEDPDSLARRMPPTDFSALLKESTGSLLQAYLTHQLREVSGEHDLAENSPALVGKVSERCARLLAGVTNPIERELLMASCADLLGVRFSSVERLVEDERKRRFAKSRSERFAGGGRERAEWGSGNFQNGGGMRPAGPQGGSQYNRNRSRNQSGFYRGGKWAETAPDADIEFTPAQPQSGEVLNPIQRQLVVTVLYDPRLAPNILETGAGFSGREPESDVETASGSRSASAVELRIRRFVEDVAVGTYSGVRLWHVEEEESAADSGDEANTPLAVEEGNKFIALLEKHGLGELGVLEEAIRQSRVGGIRPEKAVADCAQSLQHSALKESIETIRSREKSVRSQTSAAEELERLAQAKLEARRRLLTVRSME